MCVIVWCEDVQSIWQIVAGVTMGMVGDDFVKDSGLRQNLFNMNIYSITIHQVYTSMSI